MKMCCEKQQYWLIISDSVDAREVLRCIPVHKKKREHMDRAPVFDDTWEEKEMTRPL